ncbi:hypothetical protein DFS34DRAFT_42850 [Phlyctochytrium arcticum]|nr:hypothetical protein DFS34DRAFT_42850 [Phlyctochytrium arcticum]
MADPPPLLKRRWEGLTSFPPFAYADSQQRDLSKTALFMRAPSTNEEQYADATKYGVYLSIPAGLLVVLTYILIRLFHPALANRVSLRMSLVITVYDTLYAVFNIISSIPTGPSSLCSVSIFVQLVFLLLSLFTTAAIGLNLVLIFLLKVNKTKKLEWGYYFGTTIVAVTLPLVAFTQGRLGWDGSECWFTVDEDGGQADAFKWQWITYYTWIVFSITFCTACAGLFYWSVRRPYRKSTLTSTGGEGGMMTETHRMVSRAVSRIAIYCLVPLVSQVWALASDVQAYHGNPSPLLWMIANFMQGAHGFFNAIVFFCVDPSVSRARKKLRKSLVSRHYFKYHSVKFPQGHVYHSSGSIPRDFADATGDMPLKPFPIQSRLAPSTRNDTSQAQMTEPVIRLDAAPDSHFMFHFCRLFLLQKGDEAAFIAQHLIKRRKQLERRQAAKRQLQASGNALMFDPTSASDLPSPNFESSEERFHFDRGISPGTSHSSTPNLSYSGAASSSNQNASMLGAL